MTTKYLDMVFRKLVSIELKVDKMAVDLSGLQASDARLVADVGKVIAKLDDVAAQLAAALAATAASDPTLQASVDAIKKDLDTASDAMEALFTAAPPAPAATP